jgi:hypothetical protein
MNRQQQEQQHTRKNTSSLPPVKPSSTVDKYSRAMRVFRKFRSGRRRSSTASEEANSLLLSDPNAYPSEGSSVGSWGNESSLSGSANALYLVTEGCESTSSDDTVTESSSLPTHIEDFEDDSPSNWSSNSRNIAMVVYGRPRSPRHLTDSVTTWCKLVYTHGISFMVFFFAWFSHRFLLSFHSTRSTCR